MQSLGWKPTFVIGIDFGMTCTAVAYSSAPEWPRPDCVLKWTGQYQDSQLASKVTTQVAYDGNGGFVSWGFKCNWDNVPTTIEKEFKLYLDPVFPDTYPNRPSHDQAVKWYKDYMRSLHDYLDSFFQRSIPDWAQRNVEFLFSIPTTWTSPQLTAQLEAWLTAAGYSNGYNRRIKISQTEAEAAAVYAAKQSFRVGDVIMVADAGGATTDINILEIKEHSQERTQLTALNKAEGINVGSTLIDGQAKHLVKDRLEALNVAGDESELYWMAEDMLQRANFEALKCGFDGAHNGMDTYLTVPADKLPTFFRNRRQQISITAEELQRFFDEQLEVMFESISHQMLELTRERPLDSVKYLVLSGGLGSSRYVQRRLKARFTNLEVLCAPDPQLAVAKGLVMDRIQTLSKGMAIYTGKCCRVSYGVLCRQPYDKIAHRGERVTKDSIDGLVWAEDQIDWLVKEGEAVPDEGFKRPFRLKIAKGYEDEAFEAQLVMSDRPAKTLPRSLRGDSVSRVCNVAARFGQQDFAGHSLQHIKHKKGNPFSRRPEHFIADFDLKVIVGSADLKFELVGKDGQKFSQNEARVEVTWHEAKPSTKRKKGLRNMYPATP